MAIKAEFLAGQTEKRLSALYQWDYGQTLEIEAPNLPTIIEVHFACPAMTEAVVHTCSCVNGVASVAIPDQCLEQEREITAWVYEVEGTSGRTLYRVFIPIIARTRPSRGESIPVEVQDTYTQLIDEVNETVGKIADGEIMVALAAKATTADRATQADNASSAASAASATFASRAGEADKATKADSATSATRADTATKASQDANGNVINKTYVSFKKSFTEYTGSVMAVGFYQFRVTISSVMFYVLLPVTAGEECCAILGTDHAELGYYQLRVKSGKPSVEFWKYDSYDPSVQTGFKIEYRLIF